MQLIINKSHGKQGLLMEVDTVEFNRDTRTIHTGAETYALGPADAASIVVSPGVILEVIKPEIQTLNNGRD